MNSRNKGKRGELECARLFREYGYEARRGQQYSGANGDPDVTGVEYIHIECKRREKLSVYDALLQSRRDSREGEIPVVIWRKNDAPWIVVMEFDEWIKFYQAYEINRKETEDLMSLPFTEE